MILARIGRKRHVHVPYARLALEGLEAPPQQAREGPDFDAGAGEECSGERIPQVETVRHPFDVGHDILQGAADLGPDGIEIVQGGQLPPIGAQELFPNDPADLFLPRNGETDGIPQGDVGVEKRPPKGHDRKTILDPEVIVPDELGRGDELTGDLVRREPLDRRDEAGACRLSLQNRPDVVEKLGKPIHRNGQEDEVVVLDNLL